MHDASARKMDRHLYGVTTGDVDVSQRYSRADRGPPVAPQLRGLCRCVMAVKEFSGSAAKH